MDKRNTLKLSHAIASELRDEILKNKISPNQRFYSENDILEMWSCSRATAREALLLLEFEGLIVSKQGKGGGIFVSEPDTSSIIRPFSSLINFNSIDHSELMETQIELETLCGGLAAQRATQEDIDHITEVMHDFERELRKINGNAAEKNLEFHMAIAMAAHNHVLFMLMKVLEPFIYENTRKYKFTEEQLEEVIHMHQRILDAIVARDVEGVKRRIRRHIDGFIKVTFNNSKPLTIHKD